MLRVIRTLAPMLVLAILASVLLSRPAEAAARLDGVSMGWPWMLPFVGTLLSIAIGPLLFPKAWHAHFGKIVLGWALLTLAPLAAAYGTQAALAALIHTALAEYLSFILLLAALYAVAGGILVSGNIGATPLRNTAVLALGTSMASIVGTTGAAMILIRPLLRANAARPHNTHVVIFFIILVANVGGALTPLGDPPLFIGFLRGVDFFWTTQHLWLQTTIIGILLLAMFLLLDLWYFRREKRRRRVTRVRPLKIHGRVNFLLLAGIIAAILTAAAWKPGLTFDFYGTSVELQNLLRDGVLVLIAFVSLWLTPREHRAANGFTWAPMQEVAILFAGIFVAIIPVIAMLEAGRDGSFAFLLQAVTHRDNSANEAAYFWLTGILSAFLDNAPTYLVFFELASGDAKQLMGPLAGTLASISMGAVYMGALTYIGNAPNFMIYTIARERGVRMPNFFAYMLCAGVILVPLFALLTWLPIPPILKWG